jgi:type II secretory pathway pseudopilin PulG
MSEREHPVHCSQCGSIVDARENFCGMCGARVSPDAAEAAPTQQIPTQAPAPAAATAPSRNRVVLMVVAFGLALVLVLSLGSVAALNLLQGETESSKPAANQEEAAVGATDTTQPEKSEEATARKTTDDKGNGSEEQVAQPKEGDTKKEKPQPEKVSGPAPGYNLIQTSDGSLSAEVPPSWGVETGEDSEKEGGPGTWSYYVGEYLYSSITTAPSLEVWYSGEQGSSGAYFVAARVLAQYSDYEIIHSLFNASKAETCAEEGPYKDYDRPPLSGKLQTWYGCGDDGATVYDLVAYPEGRECVVALNARISDEADREAIEHLVNTLEVNCGRVTSEPLSSPSASASPQAADSPEAESSPSASTESPSSASTSASSQRQPAGPAYNFIEVPRGTPPCPLGLDEVRATYGPNVTCGEGGGYVPDTGGG